MIYKKVKGNEEKRFNFSMKCKSCNQTIGNKELIESIHRFSNGAFHIRGECPYCRAYVKYIPYQDSKTVKSLLEIAHLRNNYENIPKIVAIYDDKTKTIY